MKKIQVGNVFYENEDTKAIYDNFPEYFDVTKEYGWLVENATINMCNKWKIKMYNSIC